MNRTSMPNTFLIGAHLETFQFNVNSLENRYSTDKM